MPLLFVDASVLIVFLQDPAFRRHVYPTGRQGPPRRLTGLSLLGNVV